MLGLRGGSSRLGESSDKSEIESDISGFVSTIFMSDDAAGYDDEPLQALPVSDIGSQSLDRDVWDMMQVMQPYAASQGSERFLRYVVAIH